MDGVFANFTPVFRIRYHSVEKLRCFDNSEQIFTTRAPGSNKYRPAMASAVKANITSDVDFVKALI